MLQHIFQRPMINDFQMVSPYWISVVQVSQFAKFVWLRASTFQQKNIVNIDQLYLFIITIIIIIIVIIVIIILYIKDTKTLQKKKTDMIESCWYFFDIHHAGGQLSAPIYFWQFFSDGSEYSSAPVPGSGCFQIGVVVFFPRDTSMWIFCWWLTCPQKHQFILYNIFISH